MLGGINNGLYLISLSGFLVVAVLALILKWAFSSNKSLIEKDKINVVWQHLSYDQPNVQYMRDRKYVDSVDYFIYVSNWQYNKFREQFQIPEYKSFVIKNATHAFDPVEKQKTDKIKILYSSTPWRGLAILIKAIEILNQTEHIGVNGKRYLVTHGDLFDGITRLAPWISFLGDRAYDTILSLNSKFNWIRHRMGFGYWSLSQYLKLRVKKAIDFIFQFEKNLAAYCKKRGYDGVICGHIHHAEIKEIDGVTYMNDGDWVESCTALVEHHDGRWEIITWSKEKDSVDIITDSSTHS